MIGRESPPAPMVLRLKAWKSRSLPGLRKTESIPGLDPGYTFIRFSLQCPPLHNPRRDLCFSFGMLGSVRALARGHRNCW